MAKTVEEIIAHIQGSGNTPDSYSKEYEKFKSALEAKQAAEASAVAEPDETQVTTESTVSALEEATEQVTSETVIETQPGTAQPTADPNSTYQGYLICGAIGFLIGILVTFLYFRIRIKRIKAECEARISESRASVDKMISVIANK